MDVSLGAFYTNQLVYRGALIWDAPVAIVAPSFVFYDMVSVGEGGGISLFKVFDEKHKVSLGYSYFDDDIPGGPALKLEGREKDFKNTRKATQGLNIKYFYSYSRKFKLDLAYHKDLRQNIGNYAHIKVASSITPFFRYGAGMGTGDARNNRYVFGEEAVGGVGHVDVHGGLFLPFLPKQGVLMVNFTYSEVVQDENVKSEFIQGNRVNRTLATIAVWRL